MPRSRKRRWIRRNSSARSRQRRWAIRQLGAEPLEKRILLTTVQSQIPAANSFDANPGTDISATFDQNVTAATDQTFVVHSSQRGLLAGAASTVTTSGMTATHDPTNDLFPGERIQVTVTTGVTTAGGAAVKRVWGFQAGATGGLGTFTDSGQLIGDGAANISGYGTKFGDVDGDGDLDLFVSNDLQGSRVYLNDGVGVFTDSGQRLGDSDNRQSRDVELGDMDGDGDLDAVISNVGGQANQVLQNDGSGVFTELQSFGGNNSPDVALGDLDGDGDLDVLVANTGNTPNGVYLNDGSGMLTGGATIGNHSSNGVDLGDLDGDGDLDAITNNFAESHRVWFNDGNGGFTDSGQSALGDHESQDVTLGDLDGDGDLDAIAANFVLPDRIWFNDGNGTFYG